MARNDPDSAEIESWVAALRDGDGMVRQSARERLVRLRFAATPFLVPLLSDHDSQTRWEAAKALSEIADPASVPVLIRSLGDDDGDVSWLAAEGLASMGSPAVAPLLRTLIDRVGDAWIRRGAHHVLGELRHTNVGDAISEVYTELSDTGEDVEIIAAAERALRRLDAAAE